MFTIPDDLLIVGIEKTECDRGHIQQCLNAQGGHELPHYTFMDPNMCLGTVLVHTRKGDFTLSFAVSAGVVKSLVVL